ncbi:MAG: alkaline phosphatase family protein [Flavobacteriales bacterium]|nr:alkaline phosphatase family protein [Flavobacteriales bacterium]
MRKFIISYALLASPLVAQVPINGPMPGYSDMFEVTIWMQCHGPCNARLEYWKLERPDSILTTDEQGSLSSNAHSIDFVVGPLLPGTTYGYRVLLEGKPIDVGQPLTFKTQPLWKFRTGPPDVSIALGSCVYINEPMYDRPGKPYGSGYEIFDAIAAMKPDMMLWLGDNIYLREPDWGTRTGYLHRYTHTRSTPEMQRLLRSTQHYAIWDDHDFGPNDADGSFVNSALARDMFDLFWPNPTCGVPGVEGTTTMFTYADVDLFLMDDRTFRLPGDLKTSTPAMLGRAQLDWLIHALKYSDATFKLVAVGSSVLNPITMYENYATIAEERTELLRRIEVEGIKGVIFLTGDHHFTDLSELDLSNGRKIYDLTCSPLTSGVYTPAAKNDLQVEGTLFTERNFATISVTGKTKERILTMRVFDATGKEQWTYPIPQE